MALPKTFKAAVLETAGADLVIKDIPLQEPKQGEVLVKVIATGVCSGDVFVQQGKLPITLPIVLGHESIGDIVAVGPGEDHWKVGDRVGAPWHGGHCGFCRECKRGMFQMCANKTANGIFRNGGYAEYMTLRREATVSIPKDMDSVKYCPLLCAGVTCFNGLRHMNITAGELVGVQGIGGLGHLAVQFAAKLGFRVVVLSRGLDKEQFARELGASEYIDARKSNGVEELKAMGGAACILTTAPKGEAVAPLISGLQPAGKLLVLGAAGVVSFNTMEMLGNAISIHGWPSGHPLDSEETFKFCQHHNIDCMVETYPLEDVNRALKDMMEGKPRFRAVLKI